jgi:hypothetical protein
MVRGGGVCVRACVCVCVWGPWGGGGGDGYPWLRSPTVEAVCVVRSSLLRIK